MTQEIVGRLYFEDGVLKEVVPPSILLRAPDDLHDWYNPKLTAGWTDKYAKYLWNKTVSVIGGAPNVDERAWDAEVVIQVQGHFALPDRNKRCDVVYFQKYAVSAERLGAAPQELLDVPELKDVKFIHIHLLCDPWWKLAQRCDKRGIGWAYYGTAPGLEAYVHWDALWPWYFTRKYNTPPCTGHIALFHTLMHAAKSVFVTGMDHYASRTKNGLPGKIVGTHHLLPHIRFLRDIANEEYLHVTLDDTLTEQVSRLDEYKEREQELEIVY